MSISNRRTGKIGPPPGSYDTEWLNRLRILLEELGGLQKLPAYPSAREAVVYDGVSQIWESHSLDDWFYLGDGINDGGNIYDCPIPDPRFAFLVTGAGNLGSPPPNLNRPPIGTLAYFRADAGNTGPSYLRIHIDLPDVSGFEHEILRMDGSSLVSGDIVAGQFVTAIFDADSMVYGDPARGWRMIEGPPPDLSGYVPTSRTLTAGIGLSGGGDLSANRTIDLDITDLTAETVSASGDQVAVYDLSAAAHRKMTLGNLLTGIGAQPLDATLTALAGLTTGADRLPYSTGTDTFSQATFTAFARTLLDDADATAARATLGITAYDAETVQDLVGAMVTDSTTIDATYSDAAGTVTLERAALTGDVTASAGSNATTIANNAVTMAKLADLATDRLIGRDTAGTGAPEALTVGGGIEFTGSGGIQTSALTGDVTKTAGGTATTIAALAVSTGKLADGAVTFAKMQDIDDDVVLGRATTGSGDVEEIACTAFARSILDDADAATARTTLGAAAASHTHTSGDVTDFAEAVDDRTAALIQNGGGITWTYSDAGGTLTPAVDHGSIGGLSDDDHTQYHTDARAVTWLGTRSLADLGTRSASDLSSGTLALARGGAGTSLAATGGANQVVMQESAGANLTVRALTAADIPDLNASKITAGTLALARGGTNANLSGTGPGVLMQASSGANVSVLGGTDTYTLTQQSGAPAFASSLRTNSSNGCSACGTAAVNAARLMTGTISVSPASGVGAYGFRADVTRTSASNTQSGLFSFYSQPTINASGLTVDNVTGFQAAQMTLTAGTVSHQYGFYAPTLSGAGDNWGFYSVGGANYLGGSLGIGLAAHTASAKKLEVLDASAAQQRWSQASGVGVDMQAIAGSGWSLTPVVHATPGASSIHGAGGTGTNIAAGRLDVCGGIATGNAAGGNVRIRTSTAGSSGTGAQSLATVAEFGPGTIGYHGATPVAQSTGWAVANPVTRKSFDTTTITHQELAEAFGTLVDYLKSRGDLAA